MAAKGAYALDGFQIVYTNMGATQIAASYRKFAHDQDSTTRSLTSYLPDMATPGSNSNTINCYSSTEDLYLSGISEANTKLNMQLSYYDGLDDDPSALGSLNLVYTDYNDVFNMPDSHKILCCLGKGHFCRIHHYNPQSAKCDNIIKNYCLPLCASGTCINPICNCIGSPLASKGVAQCFDARCNSGAYHTNDMNKSICAGKDLTCEEWAALGNGAYVTKGVKLPKDCSGSGNVPVHNFAAFIDWLNNNPKWIIIFIIFIIILAFGIIPMSNNLKPPRYLNLPPGELPTLPALTNI